MKKHKEKSWDSEPPNREIFDEMLRVSRNQIIWGGNYFNLPIRQGWIFWDKCVPDGVSFSRGELAWTSFNRALKKCIVPHSGFNGEPNRFHPTQKPLKLFKWCLEKYAPENALVFDPFLGSFTTAVACHSHGLNWIGCEKDHDYFKAGMDRYETECLQTLMDFS